VRGAAEQALPATAAASTPTAGSAAPTAAAAPPGQVAERVVVGNTGGDGVSLRRSPRWSDRWPGVAWPDRTVLVVVESGVPGDDGAGGTAPWLRVRDPSGRDGYVPARYVVPMS
jgi:hypothetical protein